MGVQGEFRYGAGYRYFFNPRGFGDTLDAFSQQIG